MKIHFLSDIHLEFSDLDLPIVDADILVLAGDIGVGFQGIETAKEWATRYKYGCIYVCGNHELYHQRWPLHIDLLHKAAYKSKVTVLENECAILGGVRFLGQTLWTDFKLYGESTEGQSRLVARKNMNDYVMIRNSVTGELLYPQDTQQAHNNSVAYLKKQLQAGFDGQTVVVSHHAPSQKMMNPNFRERDPLNPAYASHLDYLLGAGIDLWLSGHTHYSTQATINGTKLVSNCRGYVIDGERDMGRPDGNFNPELVIEI